MTRPEIQAKVVEALATVAPEVDTANLDAHMALRDQVDLDSMDFLRFVVELHRQVGIEVPESDYQQLSTLAGVVDYVAAHAGPTTSSR